VDDAIVVRDLATPADYAACVSMQKETWGEQFTEWVPATILRITQMLGGVAAGAFDGDTLVGFVYGMTGLRSGRLVHWSDMLAVRQSLRNHGIGESLKRFQRESLLKRGIDRVLWTFEPLDAKNAHINFNRLGVTAQEYVVDMYGDTGSPLHAGIGTDRLVVTWDIASERVASHLAGETARPENVVATIEVPPDIHALKRTDPAKAVEWREKTRAEFQKYLPDHVVAGFVKEGNRRYYEITLTPCFST